MLKRAYLAVILSVTLVAAAVPAVHAQQASWTDRVAHGAAFYEMRGHLEALAINLGSSPGPFASESFMAEPRYAAFHAMHPIGEVYPRIEAALAAADPSANETLRGALEALQARVDAGASSFSEIDSELAAARQAVDIAQRALVGESPSDDPALNAAIAAELIRLSADEYDAAIAGGELELIVELQDAYAFLDIAHMDLFRGTTFMEYSPQQQSEYDNMFNEFYAVYDNRNDPQDSTAMALALSERLASTFEPGTPMMMDDGTDEMIGGVDAPPMMSSEQLSAGFEGSAERITNIRTLLEIARAEYMDGNSLQAGELVREAYLNEFEFVERNLDAAGQPLLRQSIETTLNETLLAEVRRNSPDVPQTIDRVMAQLSLAETALMEAAANPDMVSMGSGEMMEGDGMMDDGEMMEENGMMEDDAMSSETGSGGGCLIATAAYGTEMAGEIQALREVRDSVLLGTGSGSAFMSAFNSVYYSFSPTVADWERESPELRAAIRAMITPMVASLSIMSAAEPGSELDVAALGALVIALNVGLYVAAPAALAWRLRR